MVAIAEANGIISTYRMFGVTGDLLRSAREGSRDCRDKLFEEFMKSELGEWDGADGGPKRGTVVASVSTSAG